jgi:hypothetical protein
MSALLPVFRWFATSWLGIAVSGSNWLFPAIEAVHIVALALLLGAIILLDLRILGIGLKNKPVPQLANELSPWIFSSLVVILLSGFALFASEAMKVYGSFPFQLKIILLVAAIVFQFAVISRIARRDSIHRLASKLSAVFSIALWVGVGLAGRAIGFF